MKKTCYLIIIMFLCKLNLFAQADSRLAGEWIGWKESSSSNSNSRWTFNSDGSGTVRKKLIDLDHNNSACSWQYSFTWILSNNNLLVLQTGNSECDCKGTVSCSEFDKSKKENLARLEYRIVFSDANKLTIDGEVIEKIK